MTKIKAFFILGLFVAVLPFLGFPGTWKTIMLVISGFLVMFLSYSLQKAVRLSKQSEQHETNPPHHSEKVAGNEIHHA